jgi:hypothetical protein
MGALLGFHVGIWDYPTSYTAHAYVAHATVVQQVQKNMDLCGWMGVQVSPMTAERRGRDASYLASPAQIRT